MILLSWLSFLICFFFFLNIDTKKDEKLLINETNFWKMKLPVCLFTQIFMNLFCFLLIMQLPIWKAAFNKQMCDSMGCRFTDCTFWRVRECMSAWVHEWVSGGGGETMKAVRRGGAVGWWDYSLCNLTERGRGAGWSSNQLLHQSPNTTLAYMCAHVRVL